MQTSTSILVGLAVLSFSLAGCGGSKLVEAKGRVTDGGKPIKLGQQAVLQVIFYPEARDERGEFSTFPAHIMNREDGSFDCQEKIPAGKYRVSIELLDPYPDRDKLKGKFFGEKSPIIREVTGEPIEIDLSKPSG